MTREDSVVVGFYMGSFDACVLLAGIGIGIGIAIEIGEERPRWHLAMSHSMFIVQPSSRLAGPIACVRNSLGHNAARRISCCGPRSRYP